MYQTLRNQQKVPLNFTFSEFKNSLGNIAFSEPTEAGYKVETTNVSSVTKLRKKVAT